MQEDFSEEIKLKDTSYYPGSLQKDSATLHARFLTPYFKAAFASWTAKFISFSPNIAAITLPINTGKTEC